MFLSTRSCCTCFCISRISVCKDAMETRIGLQVGNNFEINQLGENKRQYGTSSFLPSVLFSCLIIPSSYLSLSIFLFLSFFFPSFFFLIFYFFLSWVKFIPQLNFTQPSACAYWEVGHLSEEVTSTTHCKHSTELGAGLTWANHKIVVLVQFPNVGLLWTIEVVDKRKNIQNRSRWLGSFLSLSESFISTSSQW